MRRRLWPVGLYAAITLAFAYPLLAHLGSAVPHDAGDPVLNTWLLWWNTQRLPLTEAWWNAPMFYPTPEATAFSEVLIGLLPVTAPVQWLTHSPLLAYNIAFLLSFPLCGAAAYALAHELTGRRDASLLAGLAFAFAPYRMGQLAHLQMLAYYGAPIALLGLHRYLRTRQRRWLGLFAGAWLLQALSNGYAMFHVSVMIALWIVWFVRSRRDAAAILAAWAAAALATLPVLLKYQTVHTVLNLGRDINEIKRFGVDLGDFMSAPPEVALWGARLWTARPETAVFPGAAMVGVAVVAIVGYWRQRRDPLPATLDQKVLIGISMAAGLVALSAISLGPWRLGALTVTDFHKPFSIAVASRALAWLRGPWLRQAWQRRSTAAFYVVALVVMYVLALGPEPRLLGRPLLYEPPYAWLMRLPGFATLRVPARFAMVGVLCQSVLFAMVVARRSWGSRRRLICAALGVLLVADGWPRLRVTAAPASGVAVAAGVSAVVEMPPGDPGVDLPALYRAMRDGPPMVNGYSGYYPPHYLPLEHAIRDRQFGVLREIAPGRTLQVVVNRSREDSGPAEDWLSRQPDVQVPVASGRWASYLLEAPPASTAAPGIEVPMAAVRTSLWNQDAARLHDGDIDTAWHGGSNQVGNEEVEIAFESPQRIARIVLQMGAYALGFPRQLIVEAGDSDGLFTEVWRGPTAAMTVRAAIQSPSLVPLTVDFPEVTTRLLRLRQIGHEPGIPWWIAELRVEASRGGGVP